MRFRFTIFLTYDGLLGFNTIVSPGTSVVLRDATGKIQGSLDT